MTITEGTQSPVLFFSELDQSKIDLAGGKGANLGELTQIPGLLVPPGFCISTTVFTEIITASPAIGALLDQLASLGITEREKIATLSAELRQAIEAIEIPSDLQEAIAQQLNKLGASKAYAIRSSATAEDLPKASFAGQQDSYLNIVGLEAILKHISKCWASLFTERAILYRLQNGFEHRAIHLGVLVQEMVFPEASGILFTADPVSGNRKTLFIEACFGLGEALVSGLVNADTYKVRDAVLIDQKIATKKLAIFPLPEGGTRRLNLAPAQQQQTTLSKEQVLQLAQLGRNIEAHFGQPQDVEWCWADGAFYIVQSRPITTLFPIPEANDAANHVYISVGHQQMMTDAIKPLGISIRQLTAGPPMYQAAGRLFVDVTKMLASTASRANLLKTMGQHDPLMQDALLNLIERNDFLPVLPEEQTQDSPLPRSLQGAPPVIDRDSDIVPILMQRTQSSLETLKQKIQTLSGPPLFEFLLEDFKELKKLLFDPQSFPVIMAPMEAFHWLNEHIHLWLGEKNVGDILAQSVPNNITSEMGLELMDVADSIRPFPAIIGFLQQVETNDFLEQLPQFEGGQIVRDVLYAYLQKHGMRCVGEIDITKTRWSENPSALIPMILSNLKNFAPGASKRKFAQGLQQALAKERDLLERLAVLPEGAQKVAETKQRIDLIRNYSAYREYPKYGMINRYFVYKQALLKEAERMVQAGHLPNKEAVFYLTFGEFHELVRSHSLDAAIIPKRQEEFRFFEKLSPPRIITSDGEIIRGAYQQAQLPPGALVGLAVSTGVVEGRARIILNIEEANLTEGDILVTTFTDPSWTPLFVAIKALVTEVGGLMTHGAVIAREYGLPAVVGIENATQLIQDGQYIRVHGTDGYVEIL